MGLVTFVKGPAIDVGAFIFFIFAIKAIVAVVTVYVSIGNNGYRLLLVVVIVFFVQNGVIITLGINYVMSNGEVIKIPVLNRIRFKIC